MFPAVFVFCKMNIFLSSSLSDMIINLVGKWSVGRWSVVGEFNKTLSKLVFCNLDENFSNPFVVLNVIKLQGIIY